MSWAGPLEVFMPDLETPAPVPDHANVQKSECIGDPKDPVKAVYLHGWFPFPTKKNMQKNRPPNFYLDLESANRNKLEKLAHEMHIRIAVPLAGGVNAVNKKRTWNTEDTDGFADHALLKYLHLSKAQKKRFLQTGRANLTPAQKLELAERKSEAACHAPLAKHRALIGFSDGGYMARDVALSCDRHLRDNYDLVIMSGANEPKVFREAKERIPVSADRFQGCPKFVAMAGSLDPLVCRHKIEDPVTHKMICESGRSVAEMSLRMREYYYNGGGISDARGFEGPHMIPPNSILSEELLPVLNGGDSATASVNAKATK